jgi:hypothetical protein
MLATIALKKEDGDNASTALRITKSPEGRVQICKISAAGKPTSGSADLSADAMRQLQNLAFGQTCWLPNAEEPQLRITGLGKTAEVRENRASSEPLFLSMQELQSVLSQVALP